MLRRQFMRGLAASPSALLLPESKEEVFVWKPSVEIIHYAKCALKAEQLFPENTIEGYKRNGEPFSIVFPKGKWQLTEAKFIKIEE